MTVGGSLEGVTLRGRYFTATADADSSRQLGGWSNEQQDNGDGSARLIKTRKGWKITGLTLNINDNNGDQEYLQELMNLKDFFPITVHYANREIYSGVGQIVDDQETSSMNATGGVTLQGPGQIERQSFG